MNDDALRLSDAERDAAAADLGEHFAQGRLTVEEHDERLSAVWAAKTRGELPGLFGDLPSPYGQVTAPVPPPRFEPRRFEARRFRGLPRPLRLLVAVLLAVLVITHLPLILLVGLVWILIARSHGRPAFRRVHHGHY